ncbi:hypothetical protein GRF59_26815 [Paenibacillus sp. HJL G12]|uniref:Uncharacterized protein n=1 Tax=Paenibacillus dendrobii TaxID=2691084 RepID=A0A7X3LIP9_9BACL|nr:hypothetical protein [Paenibacillus dendrobii]MWV47211.1 hypothetical protein [Paenibacillus dendrobii]
MKTKSTHSVVAAVLTFSILLVNCAEVRRAADVSSNSSIRPSKGTVTLNKNLNRHGEELE